LSSGLFFFKPRKIPETGRTFASRRRAKQNVIDMIVGHGSEVVSRSYTHLDADDIKAAISKLPDVTAR